MERSSFKQLNMVSRLPKFAPRPSSTTVSSLPQRSALPLFTMACKGAQIRGHNSLTHVPQKCEEGNKLPHTDSLEEKTSVPICSQPAVMPIKTSAPVKLKSVVQNAQSGSTRTLTQPNKTYPHMTSAKRLSPEQPLYQNGVSGGNERYESGSSGPGLHSLSQQRTLENPLSLSNDSLKSAFKENIVRSQSFSNANRAASPTDPPMTRSFSFNKATELAKELPRPLAQSPVARSPLIQPNPVLEKSGKFGISRPSVTTSGGTMPKATIKKTLLPSFSSNKPSALSYRLTRPSLTKHLRPTGARTVQNEAEVSNEDKDCTETVENGSEINIKAISVGCTPGDTHCETNEEQSSLGRPLGVLEDMSLSSSSSLEHNDTSEEYMDDFDNLGNGGEILLLPVHKEGLDVSGLCDEDNDLITNYTEDSSPASLHSFLSETVEWAGMGLTDGFEHKALSPVGDFPHGFSLDLSPSDSSGGTYMWDEEGLEVLGGSGQLCGSYDSDPNSTDILNNLENVESCDLEEDDLMLDLDLSEDASLRSGEKQVLDILVADTDGLSPYEGSEKVGHPNQRRRQHQRWTRLNQLSCESRSDILQSFDGCQGEGLERSGSDHATLDELTLTHMAQDCSSVKVQLLQLKTLLQMEADGSIEEILEVHTPESTDQSLSEEKVALLLIELQELKTELRNKEKIITELSQQSFPVKCHCRQESESHSRSVELQDKSTQTPWKSHNPQILQAPRFIPSKLHTNERQSSSAPTDACCYNMDGKPGHRPLIPQSGSKDLQSHVAVESVPNCTLPVDVVPSTSTSAFSSKTLQNSKTLSDLQPQLSKPESPLASGNLKSDTQKCPLAKSSLSTPPPPNSIKRAPTLIKAQKQVQQACMLPGALDRLGNAGLSRTKHLLLPARGLKYINPAVQATIQIPITPPIYNPQNQGFRQSQSHREPRARASLQPNHSRLPKPKTQ
ncbi:serine-rich coiled-coil domain-containing protein 2 isoform X2 [Misgurnus anguillicaudatus]|uniref:serine-rich coiled-coil domain-containing protein 2 isoform X2 n=1 Tax=Misgurnus anguillicaudatus TaxID=75329 RepID=UPI003CCFA91D